MPTFIKDPADVRDYTRDWTPWLTDREDEIASSTWTADDGITVDDSTSDTLTATVWLSGGTAGETYTVTNRITTEGGRTLEKSINVKIEDQ